MGRIFIHYYALHIYTPMNIYKVTCMQTLYNEYGFGLFDRGIRRMVEHRHGGVFDFQALWSIRERLSEAMLCDGHNYKYDVSLPLGRLYDLVTDVRQRVSHVSTRVIGYGHVGDG